MPTKELAIISARPGSSPIKELVGQQLVRLAELIRKDGAPYPLTPQLVSVWVDVFQGASITPEQAEAAFHKAETACKFWPSPADVLGFITTAKSNATVEAAEQAWDYVLEIRRTRWCPDAPGGFYGGQPCLPERIAQAARAAGVWRDFDSLEGLHVWAKKRFVESFIAWGELEQDKFLLPDGEIKELLAEFAETKALPAPKVNFEKYFEELHKSGLEYAEKLKSDPAQQPDIKRAIRAVARELTPRPPVRSIEEHPSATGVAAMMLFAEVRKRLLEERGLLCKEACDKCGKLLAEVRYTRKNEPGVFCSRECRGIAEQPTIRKDGRPRKYKTEAARISSGMQNAGGLRV